MQIFNSFDDPVFAQLLNNQRADFDDEIAENVLETILDIKLGQKMPLDYTNKFSGCSLQSVLVSMGELNAAYERVLDKKPDLVRALNKIYDRVYAFHKKHYEFIKPTKDFSFTDDLGNKLGYIYNSIESVGIYVPGGRAVYPSSVIMSFVPAFCAGVKEVYFASPPMQNGLISDVIMAAIFICKERTHQSKIIKNIYKMGGASAIASFCYGSQEVKKVDKIIGPGGSYVSIAKRFLFGEVGIDMIAGPTDLTIIADESADARCVAVDLFSQLEHGGDSRVFLLTDSQYFANLVNEQIAKILPTLSRMEIVDKSIKNSAIVLVNQIEQAADAANKIAPEHLQICTKSNDLILKYIKNAGAVFVGNYTSESFGDYILGPSHVLPTGGSARFSSGLSVMDFLKKISIMQIANKDSARLLASDAIVVAKEEGLEAHAMSMQIREDIR